MVLTQRLAKAMEENSAKLVESIKDLTKALNKSAESSDNLQKKLVFWTKVMAFAIIGQILAIILTAIFK
ncbi:hypothetical protein GF351_06335 [Candidatus Woesearchaeota archaeon]|nr:hypothetical protein [Candidatus Woesearchaeota archaeon]